MFQALFPGVMMLGPMDLLLTLQQQRQLQQAQLQSLLQPVQQVQQVQTVTPTPPPTPVGPEETFVFTQSTASASWTINHNLGQFPSVTVVDNAGNTVIAGVKYTNSNQVVVTFANPFAGRAYLNV
jgi:hypothetical protein